MSPQAVVKKVYFQNVKGFCQTDQLPVERSERGERCLVQAGSPHHHVFPLLPWQLTFIGGEKMTEVFIHSLELGHSAATRAIKASGLYLLLHLQPRDKGLHTGGAGGTVGCKRCLNPGCIMSKGPGIVSQIWKRGIMVLASLLKSKVVPCCFYCCRL